MSDSSTSSSSVLVEAIQEFSPSESIDTESTDPSDDLSDRTSRFELEYVTIEISELRKNAGYLNCWFIRASFYRKWQFIRDVLHTIKSKPVICQILRVIPMPTKDIMYSMSQCTNLLEDILPKDDNRQMDRLTLEHAAESDFLWLSEPNKLKANILIGLISLGGTPLKVKTFQTCVKIYEEIHGASQISVDYQNNSERVENVQRNKNKKTQARTFKNEESVLHMDYREKLEKFNRTLDKLKQISSIKKTRKVNGKEPLGSLDMIQMLPVWVVLKIFSYLDKQTLEVCTRVNQYWKQAVEWLTFEIKARAFINTTFSQLNHEFFSGKIKHSKNKKDISRLSRMTYKRTAKPHGNTDVISGYTKHQQHTGIHHRASNKTSTTKTSGSLDLEKLLSRTEFSNEIISCSNKRYISICRSGMILTVNISSGSNLPAIINPRGLTVTSMTMNPNDKLLAVAYSDSSLRIWDIWSCQEMKTLSPQFKVTLMACNKNYLVAASFSLIVYRWADFFMTKITEMDQFPKCICVAVNDNIYCGYHSGDIIKYNPENLKIEKELSGAHYADINFIKANDQYLFTCDSEDSLKIWDLSLSMNKAKSLKKFDQIITGLDVGKDLIFAVTKDGKLQICSMTANLITHSISVNQDRLPLTNVYAYSHLPNETTIVMTNEIAIKVMVFANQKQIYYPYRGKLEQQSYLSGVSQVRRDSILFGLNLQMNIIKRRRKSQKELTKLEQCVHRKARIENNPDYYCTTIKSLVSADNVMGETAHFPRIHPSLITEEKLQDVKVNKSDFSNAGNKSLTIFYKDLLATNNLCAIVI